MTTQFDVFANPSPASRRVHPYVVCLQSSLFDPGTRRIIAPLVPRMAFTGASRVTPVVRLDDADYAVLVPALANVPATGLMQRVANLQRHRDALLAAVDLVFYGV